MLALAMKTMMIDPETAMMIAAEHPPVLTALMALRRALESAPT